MKTKRKEVMVKHKLITSTKHNSIIHCLIIFIGDLALPEISSPLMLSYRLNPTALILLKT